MIPSFRTALVSLAAALTLGLASDGANAAPPGIPNKNVDIDTKSARLANVFRLLGQVAQRTVVLDPCVEGTLDIRLKNTPLPLVFDALALKFGLVYDEDDKGVIKVGCKASGGANAGARVSLDEKDALLPEVLQHLAARSKLEGVDYRAAAKPKVSVKLDSVRLSTAVTVLAETTNLNIGISKQRLVVTE